MKYLLLTSAALMLFGCGTPIPASEIAALESGLTAADRTALIYTTLKSCSAVGATPVCADDNVKAQIKAKEQVAYDAVKSLKSASAAGLSVDASIAQAAISAYLAVIPPPLKN